MSKFREKFRELGDFLLPKQNPDNLYKILTDVIEVIEKALEQLPSEELNKPALNIKTGPASQLKVLNLAMANFFESIESYLNNQGQQTERIKEFYSKFLESYKRVPVKELQNITQDFMDNLNSLIKK